MVFSLAELPLPVRVRPATPLTEDELLRFCSANGDLRIEQDAQGELVVMTPAGSESGGKNAEISLELGIWARRDGRGRVFDSSAGFTLPDGSMRAPDASWIAWPRWNALTRDQQRRSAPVCPDFVIELRSFNDTVFELEAKMEMWVGNGAELAWLIDPLRKIAAIYRPGQSPELLQQPDEIRGEGPVAGFVLPLIEIWK